MKWFTCIVMIIVVVIIAICRVHLANNERDAYRDALKMKEDELAEQRGVEARLREWIAQNAKPGNTQTTTQPTTSPTTRPSA